jgi:hypothetical protein
MFGYWVRVVSVIEKFTGAVTFQVTISRDFKKNRRRPVSLANGPFGDRVFRSLTRVLGLIVRSTPKQENLVLGEG